MKFVITMFVLTMIHGMAITVSASGNNDPNSLLDRVLGRYVSKDGLVDYKGLKKDKDFVRNGEKIEEYVARYLNPEDAGFIRNNKVTVKYLDYDWGLNEQK
ncbi:MAG: hypothetical protein E3K36_07570 [Candidatus Brocadia sp.]|nr:hypothetical protein [Candidatus Brocadia sp.]